MTPLEPDWFHRCPPSMTTPFATAQFTTTRRNLLMLMAATAAASATAACRETGAAGPAAARVPDVLVAKTGDGLAVVREGGLTAAGPGVLSLTGSTLCLATRTP